MRYRWSLLGGCRQDIFRRRNQVLGWLMLVREGGYVQQAQTQNPGIAGQTGQKAKWTEATGPDARCQEQGTHFRRYTPPSPQSSLVARTAAAAGLDGAMLSERPSGGFSQGRGGTIKHIAAGDCCSCLAMEGSYTGQSKE